MSRKTGSLILIFVGLLLAVVSLVADSVGLGNEVGFGWKQITSMIVGLAAMLAGTWMVHGKPQQKK